MNIIKTTTNEKTVLATKFLDDISSGNSNVYIGIGHNGQWAANDSMIDPIYETTDYINQVFRDMVAVKRIGVTDVCVVARRKDWSINQPYHAYANNIEMFTYLSATNASGDISTSGVQGYYIQGSNGTTFFTDFANGSILRLTGDGANVPPVEREIVVVLSDDLMYANADLGDNYISNTPILVTNTYPDFATNFYVRNTFDQVFVCLSNNNGSVSNTMPQISLGGQLPTDRFIITPDGYNWKYMYSIPAGLKQKFFTNEWMPVTDNDEVTESAVDGRIDIVNIVNGGSGYNNTSASFSASILSVTGDGSSANMTAQIDANGTIVGINILDAGSGYTTANLTISAGVTGTGAILQPIIGPAGGWGVNTPLQLGATTLMVSCDLQDTEGGTIPTADSQGNFFSYRQITMLHNPKLSDGSYANGTNYEQSTLVSISSFLPFNMGDTVYQSNTGLISDAFYTATVVYFNNNTNVLHLNNINGTLLPQGQMYATVNTSSLPYGTTTVFSQTSPTLKPFSGIIKYIDNRTAVERFPDQSESVRFVVQF